MTAPAIERSQPSTNTKLLGILGLGVAVSVLLGVYAKSHTPTGEKPYTLFFSDMTQLKVWFASVAVILAVIQIFLALRLYGKIHWPKTAPSWLGDAHRLTGTVAFLFTLPVAYQCVWALGFQSRDARVLIHSIAGCFFYGAFVVKVLGVRTKGLPGWVLPVVGGAVFTALVVLFLTSAGWFFTSPSAPRPIF